MLSAKVGRVPDQGAQFGSQPGGHETRLHRYELQTKDLKTQGDLPRHEALSRPCRGLPWRALMDRAIGQMEEEWISKACRTRCAARRVGDSRFSFRSVQPSGRWAAALRMVHASTGEGSSAQVPYLVWGQPLVAFAIRSGVAPDFADVAAVVAVSDGCATIYRAVVHIGLYGLAL